MNFEKTSISLSPGIHLGFQVWFQVSNASLTDQYASLLTTCLCFLQHCWPLELVMLVQFQMRAPSAHVVPLLPD